MRILVNDIAASYGGAMTILKQFYNYVKEKNDDNEWIFLLGDNYLEETSNIKIFTYPDVKASHIRKLLFDSFLGKKEIMKYEPDVVISLQNIITFGLKIPQYVYVHQSIPFQKIKKFSYMKRDERSLAFVQHFIGFFIRNSVKKANKIFVQTNWMKDTVIKDLKLKVSNVYVVFPSVELFARKVNNIKFQSNHFFYPTNCEKYKNLNLVVDACNKLNEKGFNDFEVILTVEPGYISHKNIKCIGRVNRDKICDEYLSGTLLFPSYIETVGLPLLEARALSTKILASDTPFSHECLDGYANAEFFPPFNSDILCEKMERIMKSDALPQECEYSIKMSSWELLYNELIKK